MCISTAEKCKHILKVLASTTWGTVNSLSMAVKITHQNADPLPVRLNLAMSFLGEFGDLPGSQCTVCKCKENKFTQSAQLKNFIILLLLRSYVKTILAI